MALTTHRQPWSRPPIELDFSGRFPIRTVALRMTSEISRHVYSFWSARTVLEGIREEWISVSQMGPVPFEGEWVISGQSACMDPPRCSS